MNPWPFVLKTRPKPKILKPQHQNPKPNRKLIIQNPKNVFILDESSVSQKNPINYHAVYAKISKSKPSQEYFYVKCSYMFNLATKDKILPPTQT